MEFDGWAFSEILQELHMNEQDIPLLSPQMMKFPPRIHVEMECMVRPSEGLTGGTYICLYPFHCV